jgi:outer membrane receptor protein involved in Fe transport
MKIDSVWVILFTLGVCTRTSAMGQVTDVGGKDTVQNLQTFTVNGKKPLLIRKLDRLEYNVAQSVYSNGYNALEVLAKLPGISIGPLGVYVNGKNNIYLLIDGKGQYIPMEQVVATLSHLRSENIEKIQIITNPSAKYDAASSAVIDVITKKEKMKSDIHSSYGNQLYPAPGVSGFGYRYFGGGANLNYSTGNLKFFGSLDLTGDHEFRNYIKETMLIPGEDLERNDTTRRTYRETGLNYGLGCSYDINKHSNLNVVFNSYGSPVRKYFYTEPIQYGKIGSLIPDSTYSLSGGMNFDHNRYNSLSAKYTYTINQKGTNLYVLFDYSDFFNPGSQYSSGTYGYTISAPPKSDTFSFIQHYRDDIYSYHADLEQALGKHFIFETGAKITTIRNVNNSTTYYALFPLTVNIPAAVYSPFTYQETITGGYVNLRANFSKFSFQAGLRGENTDSKGTANPDEGSVSRNYFNLFPSGAIQYNMANHDQLGLSYAEHIARPSYSAFNPNTIYSTILTSTQGNPDLKPQILNDAELTFVHHNAYLSVSFSHEASPKIDLPTAQQDSGITITDYTTNLKYTNTLNADVNIPFNVSKIWQFYIDAGILNNSSLLLDGSNQSNWFVHCSTGQTLTISGQSKVEVNFDYSSGMQFAYMQTYTGPNLSIGYKQFLFQKKLALSLNVNDVLGTSQFSVKSNYNYLYDHMQSIKNDRFFRLSATYEFKTGSAFSLQKHNSSKGDFGEQRL